MPQRISKEAQQAIADAQALSKAQSAADQRAGRTSTAPNVPLPPIPERGGRLIIDKRGDQTVITSAALPPEVMPLARMAQETALGLFGIIAAVVILGPFARMIARRMDRRTEIKAAGEHTQVLQQQIMQLQQSVDAMSLEVERISESQRFQAKLLSERK